MSYRTITSLFLAVSLTAVIGCGGGSKCDQIVKDVCGDKASAECKDWVKKDWLEGAGENMCKMLVDDGDYKSKLLPAAKKSMKEDLAEAKAQAKK